MPPVSESVLSTILSPIFPTLDEPLIDYLSSLLATEINNNNSTISSTNSLYELIGELILSYEAVQNQSEAKQKCNLLLTELQSKGIIKSNNTATTTAATAKPVIAAVSTATAANNNNNTNNNGNGNNIDSKNNTNPTNTTNGTGAVNRPILSAPIRIADLNTTVSNKPEFKAYIPIAAPESLKDKARQQKKRAAAASKAESEAKAATERKTWNMNQSKQSAIAGIEIYLARMKQLSTSTARSINLSKDIYLEDLQLLAPDNTELLANTELKLVYGRRYGMLGRNGIGKTTLLRQIANYSISGVPTHLKILIVEQEQLPNNDSVLQSVLNSDLERNMLLTEEQQLLAQLANEQQQQQQNGTSISSNNNNTETKIDNNNNSNSINSNKKSYYNSKLIPNSIESELSTKLSESLERTLRESIELDTDKHLFILYDEATVLSQIIITAFSEMNLLQSQSKVTFINFTDSTVDAILAEFALFNSGDCCILIQSQQFRLNDYRIRLELFKRSIKTMEFVHLNIIKPSEYNAYIAALSFSTTENRPLALYIKSQLDASKYIKVECKDGSICEYSSGMNECKLNIGDYSTMPDSVGGTFPIGEVFTESKELSGVNGILSIYAYPNLDKQLEFVPNNGRIQLHIKAGQIVSVSNSTPVFNELLSLIRAGEGDEIYIREFGMGLNRGMGMNSTVSDIFAYERQYGMHISIGKKHNVYKAAEVKQKQARYHIDVFVDVKSIEVDGNMMYQNDHYTAPPVTTTMNNNKLIHPAAASNNSNTAVSNRLNAIYERLNEIESWSAESRAAAILSGLQFTKSMQQQLTKDLSGGWRMRVALAAALFINPAVLLLDEPTNHLDFPAVLWLQNYLVKTYKHTLVVISHDRTFLNEVITDSIHFNNNRTLEQYRGDYNEFLRQKQEKYIQAKRVYEAQQMKRAHIQSFIDTYYTEKKSSKQASKIGQVESRQKVLDKMIMLPDPDKEDSTISSKFELNFPDPEPLRVPQLVDVKNVSFKYDSTTKSSNSDWLLKDINCKIEIGARIGVLGANGSGKSTLIHLIIGDLQPQLGSITLNGNLRIALFTQHHLDSLKLGLTPLEQLAELFPGELDVTYRKFLGRFGLTGDWALMRIGNLSGGQKSRLAFAIMTWKEPNLIILDEPTNHLDMESIDLLITALSTFKGSVLAVSHDQYFLAQTMKLFWAIGRAELKIFNTVQQCKQFSYSYEEAK